MREQTAITGKITRRVYDTSTVQQHIDEWQNLSDKAKLAAVRDCEADDEEVVYNVTTARFHEYLVDNLDPDQTAAKDDVSATWLGLGDGGSGGTSVTDTDLNNRTYEEQVTDHADDGSSLIASTFIDSTEANSAGTLDELGLFTGDPANLSNADVFLLNHATFSPVTKDNTKTLTFDVELSFADT